jgi:hypothetical protein
MHHLFPTITSVQSRTGRGVVYKMQGSNLSSARAGCNPISSELIIPLFSLSLPSFPVFVALFPVRGFIPIPPTQAVFSLPKYRTRGEKEEKKNGKRKTKLENLINVKIAM